MVVVFPDPVAEATGYNPVSLSGFLLLGVFPVPGLCRSRSGYPGFLGFPDILAPKKLAQKYKREMIWILIFTQVVE
jgi:hypothetical protein